MTSDAAQHVFAALADPARRQIIEALTDEGARTATQLAPALAMTRQGVTKHLNILSDAGLVTIHQRGRDKYYVLTPEPLETATVWISAIAARWDDRLEALRQFIEADDDLTGED